MQNSSLEKNWNQNQNRSLWFPFLAFISMILVLAWLLNRQINIKRYFELIVQSVGFHCSPLGIHMVRFRANGTGRNFSHILELGLAWHNQEHPLLSHHLHYSSRKSWVEKMNLVKLSLIRGSLAQLIVADNITINLWWKWFTKAYHSMVPTRHSVTVLCQRLTCQSLMSV